MDITASYILFRVIFGMVICLTFGYLQSRYQDFNLIYVLLALFVGSGIYCLIVADEILYVLITIYFISATAIVAFIRFLQFIKDYRKKQSEKNKSIKSIGR